MSIKTDSRTEKLVNELATLFNNISDSSKVDDLTLENNFPKIWELRELARKIKLDNT